MLTGKILLEIVKANVTKNNTFVSGGFTWSKKDGSKRRTRNLKKLNTLLDYKHFEVEPLKNVLELRRAEVYIASIDPKDLFLLIPQKPPCLLDILYKTIFEICICQMDMYNPCKYLQA